MIERLPTPWGLVRLGVAPDHPKLKDVSRAFERTALRARLSVLRQRRGRRGDHARRPDAALRRRDLRRRRADRQPARRSRARSCRDRGRRPSSSPGTTAIPTSRSWSSTSRASARSSSGRATSRSTSPGCSRSRARSWRRRTRPTARSRRSRSPGSARSWCSRGVARRRQRSRRPELKELGELAGADIVVDPAELELDAASASSLEGNTNATRNMEVLREFASREPTGKPRRVVLRFLVSPVAIVGERRGRSGRDRAQRARRGGRSHQRARDRTARDDSGRDRLPQRRLPRRRVARAPVRSPPAGRC